MNQMERDRKAVLHITAVAVALLCGALLLAMMFGCSLFDGDDDAASRHHATTPAGFRVWTPVVWQSGVSEAQALGWVDQRIAEWKAYRIHTGFTQEALDETAAKYTYVLMDDYRFRSLSTSPDNVSGYAAGEHDPNRALITTALYTVSAGQMPADGVGFAAITHELEHAVGIHHGDPRAHW